MKAHSDFFFYAEELPAPEECHSFYNLQMLDSRFIFGMHMAQHVSNAVDRSLGKIEKKCDKRNRKLEEGD